ncbi:LYR motif-containing protein 1-like [Littorina saxatilis]|uniref:Complex 1 LYR protein domain-containing protein n=1 Tax=Littorina saxatilis TaxID=31220 RepID=A0AAN9BXM4_9CAEN
MAYRGKVLSLYCNIFRMARNWRSPTGQPKETEEEKKYIIAEARKLFRKNKNVTEEQEIREHVRECETRIELALHYGTPYPRQVNIPQSTLPPTSTRLKKAQKRSIEQSKPVYLKSYDDTDK